MTSRQQQQKHEVNSSRLSTGNSMHWQSCNRQQTQGKDMCYLRQNMTAHVQCQKTWSMLQYKVCCLSMRKQPKATPSGPDGGKPTVSFMRGIFWMRHTPSSGQSCPRLCRLRLAQGSELKSNVVQLGCVRGCIVLPRSKADCSTKYMQHA